MTYHSLNEDYKKAQRIIAKEIGRAKILKDWELVNALKMSNKALQSCVAYKEKYDNLHGAFIELASEYESYKRGQR